MIRSVLLAGRYRQGSKRSPKYGFANCTDEAGYVYYRLSGASAAWSKGRQEPRFEFEVDYFGTWQRDLCAHHPSWSDVQEGTVQLRRCFADPMSLAHLSRDKIAVASRTLHEEAAAFAPVQLSFCGVRFRPAARASSIRVPGSAQMMIFYFIVGIACVLGAMAGYLFLRRWGRVPALIGVLLGFFAGGLLFPFPIHGGVTFLGGVLWEELTWWAQKQADRREDRRDENFRRTLEQRFAGDLPFVLNERVEGLWMEAVLEDGSVAWYDTESGLVWGDAQTVPSWEPGRDIDQGQRFCSKKPPAGYWALPTEGELFSFWEHAGYRVSPWTGQSTPSVLVDEKLKMQIPVWHRGSDQTVAVRCVARSPRAPKIGYLRSDIDLSQWNLYQMDKAEALRGTL